MLTPDEEYGLWLNVPRIRAQWAAASAIGTATAQSTSQLDDIWGDALARFPEEAGEILFQMNTARAMAAAGMNP